MNELHTKTIKEIALDNPATIRIFQDYKIDFCCGGKRLFDDACAVAGVDPETVAADIRAAARSGALYELPEFQTATSLINHIEKKHHRFTRHEIERLTPMINKVVARHAQTHRELIALQMTFDQLCCELLPHMHKEEASLFPYIKHLEMSAVNNLKVARPPFCTVDNPIRMMTDEHDSAGEILREMREITSDYRVPEDACISFRALYQGLEELENDLHRHIHLENNILFPHALELEKEVLA